jgi:hypothetical protein
MVVGASLLNPSPMIYIYESFITYSSSFPPVYAQTPRLTYHLSIYSHKPRAIFQPNLRLPTLSPSYHSARL